MRVLLIFLLPIMIFAQDVKVQILGSGGPELDKRASASYLIWIDNKAKILVDFGGGAFARLGESGAQIEDIDMILLTHFHIDHVADFAALVKATYFVNKKKVIKVFGPDSSRYFPSTKEFLAGQFENSDVYSYMSEALDTSTNYVSFRPYVFDADTDERIVKTEHDFGTVELIGVNHGNVPSLAYKVTIDGKSILFSADTSGITDNLITLGEMSDIFIAHHAIPEHAIKVAEHLHMTPTRIGKIASQIKPKNLILSHRMQRTIGKEKESIKLIRNSYQGKITLAEDLLIISLPNK